MIGTTLISCITGGFSIGLGCGTCCSPAIGVFLSTYIVSHSQNMKKALIGYASTISITNAILLGLCFSMASIISPMIVVVLLAGIISNNLYEELPKYIDLFKLMCYGVLIFIGIKTL